MAERLKAPAPPGVGTVSIWIRDHLLKVGQDYAYGMWSEWKSRVEEVGYTTSTYQSFAKYIWILKELGLIRRVGKKPSEMGLTRVYYRIVSGKEKDKAWDHPQRVLAEKRGWKPTWLGRRRYRRRILGIPPKEIGRPRSFP